MYSRCDNDNKIPVPLEAEVIPVLHSVAEANTTDESVGEVKQENGNKDQAETLWMFTVYQIFFI